MSQQWYLSRQGQRYGPYSWEQLCDFASTEQVVPQDLVWSDGMTDWVKAAEVTGLFEAPPPSPISDPPPTPVEPAQQQAPPSSQAQSASPSGDEGIAGIIPAVRRKTGLFTSKMYSLIVTNRRIIFAELTSQMLNQAAKDAAAEAKEQGKGFLARAADTMKSQQRIYQKYLQMSMDAILAENSGNYFIELRDISSVKIRHGMFHEDQGQYDKDEMHIKTTREKMKLTFEYDNSNDAKKLLRSLLGKTVR